VLSGKQIGRIEKIDPVMAFQPLAFEKRFCYCAVSTGTVETKLQNEN
jgi:hypothetical protein